MNRLEALVDAELAERLATHRDAWPEARQALVTLSGRAVAGLLDGTPWKAERVDDDHCRLILPGFSTEDEEELTRLLPAPEARIWLTVPITLAPRLVDPGVSHVGQAEPLGQLLPTGAARLGKFIVAPVLAQLLGCWRLRTEPGPKTLKGRLAVVQAARDAHTTLGLDPGPSESLLDPTIDAARLDELRRALASAWSRRPKDFADRVLLLLTSELALQAHKKRRRDGTVREDDVLGAKLRVRCEATLGGWEALAEYLGLGSGAAPRPQASAVRAPDAAPPEVTERLAVLRAWWQHADAAWDAQAPGAPTLWGMTPERRHPIERVVDGETPPPSWPPFAESGATARLWGTRTDKREPAVLLPEINPAAAMAGLLGVPYKFWESVALTVYYLTHGPYSRTSLANAPEYYGRDLDLLVAAATPVGSELWSDLRQAAGACEPKLLSPDAGVSITVGLAVEDSGEIVVQSGASPPLAQAFEAMRDVTTRHRRDWMMEHLERWLDDTWRRDLAESGTAYAQKVLERDGRPLTLRQAWPLIGRVANRWFAGDYSRLARVVALDGPITTPPELTSRALPQDLAAVTSSVAKRLDGDPLSRDWPTRRRGEIAGRTQEALEHWVVTGKIPPPRAIGVSELLETAWPLDPEGGYAHFLVTVGSLLHDSNHPAADAFMAAGP